MSIPLRLLSLLTLAFAVLPVAAETATFDDGLSGLELEANGEKIPYRVFGLYVSPGARVPVRVADCAACVVESEAGELRPEGKGRWSWVAPSTSGLYPVRVTDGGRTALLNVFVIVPIDRVEGGKLNGYRIGSYPATALKGLTIYRPPAGFVEVTPENRDTLVSPHFRVSQFLCKQEGGHPKYVVLRERLLLKLEHLLARANDAGLATHGFHVMSGYRTPYYNAAIGNVKYSRHVWGGAADIFIDENPRDGMMDDLNRDGAIDWRDAAVLYQLIDGQYGKKEYEPFVGGLGRYKKTAAHGPFVHVDVRGRRARWGT